MTLNDVLLRPAGLYPEKAAVKYLGIRLTYDEFLKNVCRTANALRLSGVGPGNTVCIACRNSIEYMEAMFAVSFVGAVPALLNWRISAVGIAGMIKQTGARIVFISNTEGQTIEYLRDHCPYLRLIITGHDPALPSNYADFIHGMPGSFSPVQRGAEDIALIMFTSGTTGRAKGVAIPNRAVDCQVTRCSHNGFWNKDDIFLCMSPLCHSISVSVMALIYSGGELLLCPPEYVRYSSKVLELIESERVTSTAMVPTVINRIVTYMEENGLRNDTVNCIHYGASPMSRQLIERCSKVFACRFHQGYGMTETYGTVATLLPEDHFDEKHLLSVGRPVSGTQFKVVDDKGLELPFCKAGEICIKCNSVMSGYIGMPAETNEVLIDGWYHSGDIGYIDCDGYIYLKDRKSDMIISGGENVFPQEIERCIMELTDDVASVSVVGLSDDIWGECIAAAVVRAPGSHISSEQIVNYCGERLGRYKKPKKVIFVDELPTNDTGKVSRILTAKLFSTEGFQAK